MNKFYQKYNAIFSYTFFGTLASTINVLLFYLLETKLAFNYLLANCIAYLVALIFTFITNKYLVFDSKHASLSQSFKEFCSFCNVRFFSFLLDIGLMFTGVQLLSLYKTFAKIIDQVICGILNYFFSKWFIFKTTAKFLPDEEKN